MKLAHSVDPLGRIVIPVQIRQQASIQPGDALVATYDEAEGVIKLRPVTVRAYAREQMVNTAVAALQRLGIKVTADQFEKAVQALEDQQSGADLRKGVRG